MTLANAAVLNGPRDIKIETFDVPPVGADDGVLRVEACGVCASDIPVYRGDKDAEYPVILGHEVVGRIADVGPNAKLRWGVSPGDRVVLERWIPCGHCDRCYEGTYRLCVPTDEGHKLFYGGTPTTLSPALYGGYADYLYLHPDAVIYPVGGAIPPHIYPLFTPIGNAFSWLHDAGAVRPGDTVAILGPGQEGLAAVLAARSSGASRIIVVGLDQDGPRLDIASDLGATLLLVEGHDEIEPAVRNHTHGRMADVVLDVTSTNSTDPLVRAVDLSGFGARIVTASFHADKAVGFDSTTFLTRQLSLHGVFGRERWALKAALRLIEDSPEDVARLTSHSLPVSETEVALRMVAREIDSPDGAPLLHVSVTP